MKELEEPLKQLDPGVAQYREIQQEKHFKLIGSMAVQRGHRLYAVNMDNLETTIATVEVPTAILTKEGTVQTKKRVYYAPNIYYTSALNAVNALKHYFRAVYKHTGARFQVVGMMGNQGVVRRVG